MTSIFSSNFNTINATSTFGGTLFNNIGSGSYGSTSGLFNGNTYGSSGLFGSNFGYGGYGYFGNTFGSYFGSPWGSLGSIWGRATTPVVTPTDTVTRTTGTTIATKQTDEEENLSFLATDFAYLGGEVAASMQITDLPDHGTLEVDGHEVSLNETIGVDEFDNMDYIPDDDFDGTDTFSVKLSEDGATYDSSNSIIQINVLGENDAPDMNTLPTFSVAEGGTLDGFGDEIIAAFTDVDTGDYLSESVVEFESGEEFGELTYISDAGSTITIFHDEDVTLSANEISTLQFVAGADSVEDEGDTELVKLRLRPSDSEGEQTADSHYLTIQVADGNDAPEFDGYDADVTVEENLIDTGLETNPATDAETPNTLQYSITGTDADLFNVDAANGAVSFKVAPDYEDPKDSNKDQDYVFTLTVEDEGGLTASTDVTVTVGDAKGTLALTVPTSTVAVDEGETLAFTATASTADTSNELTFSIGDGGEDGDLFDIDPTDGTVTFKSVPDAEDLEADGNTDNYQVEVVVTDSADASVSKTVTVSITDIHDEDPEFASIADGDSSVSGASPSSATINIADDDEGELEIEIQEITDTSDDADLATITFANGENTPASATEFSYELSGDDDVILNFAVSKTASGAANISLKDGATLDYEEETSHELTLTVTDAGGDTAQTDITVTVLGVNEAPEPTGSILMTSVKETGSVDLGDLLLEAVSDPEGDELFFDIQAPSENDGALKVNLGGLPDTTIGLAANARVGAEGSLNRYLSEAEVETLEFFGPQAEGVDGVDISEPNMITLAVTVYDSSTIGDPSSVILEPLTIIVTEV